MLDWMKTRESDLCADGAHLSQCHGVAGESKSVCGWIPLSRISCAGVVHVVQAWWWLKNKIWLVGNSGGAEEPVLKYTATPVNVNLFLVQRVL